MSEERKTRVCCLVWLEWPEKCFRVDTEALRLLKSLVGAKGRVQRVRSEAAFLKALPQATHVITWHFQAAWYERATRLQVVATPAAGRELVAQNAPRGVKVHFGGFHGAIMSESVVAFIFAWARGFFQVERCDEPTARAWPRSWLSDKCHLVAGTRAVVLGYGRVGRAIGEKLSTLGVAVTGIRRANLSELPRAARTADWLVLALPSDTGTDNLLNRALIARLPRRCVVINVGRGNAVDESALVAALRTKRLAGAYLDVFKDEPTALETTRAKGRDASVGILSLPRDTWPKTLVAMPHASAFSSDYLKRCFQELKDDGIF